MDGVRLDEGGDERNTKGKENNPHRIEKKRTGKKGCEKMKRKKKTLQDGGIITFKKERRKERVSYTTGKRTLRREKREEDIQVVNEKGKKDKIKYTKIWKKKDTGKRGKEGISKIGGRKEETDWKGEGKRSVTRRTNLVL